MSASPSARRFYRVMVFERDDPKLLCTTRSAAHAMAEAEATAGAWVEGDDGLLVWPTSAADGQDRYDNARAQTWGTR